MVLLKKIIIMKVFFNKSDENQGYEIYIYICLTKLYGKISYMLLFSFFITSKDL